MAGDRPKLRYRGDFMRKAFRHAAIFMIGLVLGASGLAADVLAADSGAPSTARGDAVDVIHGVAVADPYRWLESGDDPKVDAWTDAQNVRARAALDAVPARGRLKAKLTELIKTASSSYSGLTVRGGRVFAVFHDPSRQQPLIVTLDGNLDPATQRVVLDPNVIDAKGGTSFDWFEPSRDGTLLAVSLSMGGSEDGTLHIIDVATGKDVDKPIPRVQYPTAGGSMAWTADGKGFWYTRYPGDERPAVDQHFHQQLYFHRLGQDAAKDALILGEQDGLPRIAEIKLDNQHSPDTTLAAVQYGDGGTFSHWILREGGAKTRITRFEDKIVDAAIGPDKALYLMSRDNAPRGKVLKVLLADPVLAKARVIVPESEPAMVNDFWSGPSFVFTKDRMLISDIVGGPSQVRVFDLAGMPKGTLSVPPLTSVNNIAVLPQGDVVYDVAGYLRPRYYARWNAAANTATETKLAQKSPVSFDDAEVIREFAVSKDGTRVPVTIVRRKGAPMDGSNPTLLTGYGGYGISSTPGFLGPRWRLWLDAGGIFAEANIRGGAEYGQEWHTQGNLTNKQNVFDDFAAVARLLTARGYTSPARLALMGGSNGGLLMGAMMTQHPALARAVVASVGLYDMVRVELEPNGAFNTTEFGTVKNLDQFKALHAYSPYHRVTAGAKYPAVLLLTGANDGRVNPWQSRKFAAALQAATASEHPILLRVSKSSGHGIGSALDERIEQQADILAFLYGQLGLK